MQVRNSIPQVPRAVVCGWMKVLAAFLLCAVVALPASAQTFKTLVTFNGTNGKSPSTPLVEGFDGDLYGTGKGGLYNAGQAFRVSPTGILTILHLFCAQNNCPDGNTPNGELAEDAYGNFYGTTIYGGTSYQGPTLDAGTIFRMTPSGTLTTLYNLCSQNFCVDGQQSYEGLARGRDGNFYGTTVYGGNGQFGNGTIFKITPKGALTTLYSFCPTQSCLGGLGSYGGLSLGADGQIYGTDFNGGADGGGAVFSIGPRGMFTTLYDTFIVNEGPLAGVVQAADGNIYGTTIYGGTNNNGTVFRVTPEGALTTLHRFCVQPNCPDGSEPGGLTLGTDGNFYGTTNRGGNSSNSGTIFRITPEGTLTTLYRFSFPPNTSFIGDLVQRTDGDFYGTTQVNGTGNNWGTIFRLCVGLRPFVKTVPTSGKVGARATILGKDLTGATAVRFNGTAATFKISSPTDIVTSVPAGATSGTVTVTLPSGTLTSNVTFTVLP